MHGEGFISGKRTVPADAGYAEDVIRELEITQIELKLQNEELKAFRARIEEEMARYHDLYDFAPVGYFTFDRKGMIVEANLTAASMLGVERRWLIGKPFFLFIVPEHRMRFHAHQHDIFRGRNKKRIELRLLKKDRSEFDVSLESAAEVNEESSHVKFRSAATDITEYKEMEKTLQESNLFLEQKVQERTADLSRNNKAMAAEIEERKKAEKALKDLTARLHEIRERERFDLSREMHDEFGQDLVSIKMEASWIVGRLEKGQGLLIRKARSIVANTDKCIRKIRRIASSLRPPILDDYGVAAAIEWQSGEFEKRTGIRCRFDTNAEHVKLEGDSGVNVFRIFQESLTNVARHSGATEIDAFFRIHDGTIVLEVRDNGRGIRDDEISHPGSLGILGMKERAALIGGVIEISRPAGGGTLVRFTMPARSA